MNAKAMEKIYTIEDIYALPEGQRAELIDGVVYNMAPPNTWHQILVSSLNATIYNYIKKNNGSCIVVPAPFAVFLNKDDTNYVEPDISVICDKNKLTDDGCVGAPDWVIEITSPSSRRMDFKIKLFKYRSAGVREYWIVDPKTKTVLVYNFENDDSDVQYSFDDTIPAGIYEDLSIRISDYL